MRVLLVGASIDNINFCKEHSHDCWEIVIPTKGRGIVEAKGEKTEFKVGTIYAIPPKIKHITYSDSYFSDCYIQTEQLNIPKNKVTSVFAGKDILSLGNIIKDSYLKREAGFSKTSEYALGLISQMIYDLLNESNINILTKEIRNFLIENISNPIIDMKFLAEKFGYNGDYIRRIFKEDFGITPMEYINELKLTQAKELLLKMKMYSIDEIATLCGFSDQFYFSRFFKKHTGLSPSEYRKT